MIPLRFLVSFLLCAVAAPALASPARPVPPLLVDYVQSFEKVGVPAADILLGVPFHSRTWEHVSELNHGLFQPGQSPPQASAPCSLLDGTIIMFWGYENDPSGQLLADVNNALNLIPATNKEVQ
jgi:hypothetical protein